MENELPYSRALFWVLLAFAFTAVASIALQNSFIWAAVALFLFAHWQVRRKIEWPKGLFSFATLIFLFTFFLGTIIGVNPAKSLLTANKKLTFLLIFFLGGMAIHLKEIRKLLFAFVGGATFCALRGMWEHFLLHQERIDSFSGDKMVFGGMLMVALLLLVAFLKENPKNPWLWISLPLISAALVFTQTRGAWLGFIAGFVVLAWRLGRKWLLAGLVTLVAIYFILPPSLQDRIKTIPTLNLSYDQNHRIFNSSQTRVIIWVSGWRMIQDYPWGVGPGNIGDIFPKYKISTLYTEETEPHLHNNFLTILAENGWLGLGAYLFWILSYYWTALKFKPATPMEGNLNWVFLAIFFSILVWGMTEYSFSHQFMNIQFFLLGLQINLWKKPNLKTGIAPG
jgi:O-antigen ligase